MYKGKRCTELWTISENDICFLYDVPFIVHMMSCVYVCDRQEGQVVNIVLWGIEVEGKYRVKFSVHRQ